jgi:type II secretory pathway component PulJ
MTDALMGRIGTVFDQLGGRATNQDLQAHVESTLTIDERSHLVRTGLSTRIASFFRQRAESGLPQAPEIDEHGTHAQLDLLSVEEWRYVVRQYMLRSLANRRKARDAADLCFQQHAVLIDIDDPLAWTVDP